VNDAKPTLGGRSLIRGETTADELRTLAAMFADAAPLLSDDMLRGSAYDSVVIDGDLVLPALDTFAANVCNLVVRGNLTVEGLYADYDDPATGVFVLGDFRAKNVDTSGTLAVAGDVFVDECLVGNYNDYGADLRGVVTARVFIPENHFFALAKAPRFAAAIGKGAQHRVSEEYATSVKTIGDQAVRELFVDELWDEAENTVRYDELRKRLREGRRVLR